MRAPPIAVLPLSRRAIEIQYLTAGSQPIVLHQAPRGLSAYQLAVANGFVGPLEDWLESLAADFTIEAVTLAAGSPASVQVTGTAPNKHIILRIPKGDRGDNGTTGGIGIQGAAGSLTASQWTLATLPAASANFPGIGYLSDGQKPGEALGAGTGIFVWSDGQTWRRMSDDVDVVPYSGWTFALDFRREHYRVGNSYTRTETAVPGRTYTRAGAKSELLLSGSIAAYVSNVPAIIPGEGLWSRPAKTNVLVNAGQNVVLASQSVSVTAQPYVLIFIGTGSIDLSGAHVATLNGTGATAQVRQSFTPSAGTLTLTVTGDVRYAVLASGVETPPIIATTATPQTVAAEAWGATANPNPMAADNDFVFIAVFTHRDETSLGGTRHYGSMGTNTDRLALYQTSTGMAVLSTVANATSYAGGGAAGGANLGAAMVGRNILSVRRRAGKWRSATRTPDGTARAQADTAVLPFPVTSGLIAVGRLSTVFQPNALIEFIGVKPGTFSDAEHDALVASFAS